MRPCSATFWRAEALAASTEKATFNSIGRFCDKRLRRVLITIRRMGNPLPRAPRPGLVWRGRLRPAQRAGPPAGGAPGRTLARTRPGFDAVITGTLRRHADAGRHRRGLQTTPHAPAVASLNEYDSHALIAAIHPSPWARRHARALPRAFPHPVRRAGAVDGRRHQPQGMPSWNEFSAGVRARWTMCATTTQARTCCW